MLISVGLGYPVAGNCFNEAGGIFGMIDREDSEHRLGMQEEGTAHGRLAVQSRRERRG